MAFTIPLDDPKAVADWKESVGYDLDFDDAEDALVFVRYYEDFLKANPSFVRDAPEAAATYAELLVAASWVALPFLGQKEGLALVQRNVLFALRDSRIDVWEKIRAWLTNVIDLQERETLKRQVLQVLRTSSTPVDGPSRAEGGPLTVGEWISRYVAATGGAADPLAQSQYFFSDPSFSALPVETREPLRKLFALVDRLALASTSPEGFEEDVVVGDESGVVAAVSGGKELALSDAMRRGLRAIRRAATPEEERQRLLAVLRGSDDERGRIELLEAEIGAATGGAPERLRDALAAEIPSVPGKRPDPLRVVATLRLLARAGGLDGLLRSDKRFFDLVTRRYQDAGAAAKVDDLKVYPTSPAHLSALLQVLLRQFAGLGEGDAARFSLQIANIMRKQGKEKYLEIAHFDEDADAFRFSEQVPGAAPARATSA